MSLLIALGYLDIPYPYECSGSYSHDDALLVKKKLLAEGIPVLLAEP
jgi:hypothetical protein